MSKAEELAEEMLRLADLSDAGRGPAKSDPRRQAAAELRRLAALEKAIMDAEPVAWLVCSVNKDKSLSLEHAAPWKEAAHEHINDAINEYGLEEAASWIVREVYTLNGIKP